MKETQKTRAKPFGLGFLTEVPADELAKINGGRRHRKHHHGGGSGGTGTGGGGSTGGGTGTGGGGSTGGGTLHTMAMSMPQPAFPQGDSF